MSHLQQLPDLISRHQVDPGHLVHVGAGNGVEVSHFYEAGFVDITLVEPNAHQARALRTRFPGVEVVEARCFTTNGDGVRRLDAIAPSAQVAVIDVPNSEQHILAFAPWASLTLLVINTRTKPDEEDDHVSPYDRVTEIVTTRGFVEVDRWTRETTPTDPETSDVVFMKVG